MKNLPTHRSRGFSLIELLVVVSVIMILIAILMPALTNVRVQGRSTVCDSNLHQLHQGYFNYKAEHRGKMEAFGWQGLLAPYIGGTRGGGVMNCPEALASGGTGYSEGLGTVVLEVFSGGNFLYEMELAPGPLTFLVTNDTTDDYIITEIDPDLTPSEIASIPENGFRLYFEDLRPHGGDRDFRDVVLEIEEGACDSGQSKITYIQDAAGYTFNLVYTDTREIIWEDMNNGGKTPPGSTECVQGAVSSYGINEAAPDLRTGDRNPILFADYYKSVVVAGYYDDSEIDTWEDVADPQTGVPSFARHFGRVNALYENGGLAPLDPAELDPQIVGNAIEYWWPDDKGIEVQPDP